MTEVCRERWKAKLNWYGQVPVSRKGFPGGAPAVLLDATDHVGNHPRYRSAVFEQRERIGHHSRGLADADVAKKIQAFADKLRTASDAGTFRRWF